MNVTERLVLDLLWSRLSRVTNGASRRYIMAEHVRYDPTYGGRIIDALSIDTWGSGQYACEGYEVKVSRSDWLRELRDPAKALTWQQHCTQFFIVAPPGVVLPGELPAGWGHLVAGHGPLRVHTRSPRNTEPVPLQPRQIAAIMRAVQQTAENHLRRSLT